MSSKPISPVWVFLGAAVLMTLGMWGAQKLERLLRDLAPYGVDQTGRSLLCILALGCVWWGCRTWLARREFEEEIDGIAERLADEEPRSLRRPGRSRRER